MNRAASCTVAEHVSEVMHTYRVCGVVCHSGFYYLWGCRFEKPLTRRWDYPGMWAWLCVAVVGCGCRQVWMGVAVGG